MNQDAESYFEILGVKAGASAQEIKAAYKDLAKVWHPDRFAHDPPLQQKAQEKLKEINEAYAHLKSAKPGRRVGGVRASGRRDADEARSHVDDDEARPRPARVERTYGWRIMGVGLAVFVITTLMFASSFISRTRNAPTGSASDSGVSIEESAGAQPDAKTKQAAGAPERKVSNRERAARTTGSVSRVEPVAETPRALPTVSVVIDPATGLLAASACPSRQSMTYPAGQQPLQHCNAAHATAAAGQKPKENKSRLKTLAERVASPKKWLTKKGAQPPAATANQN